MNEQNQQQQQIQIRASDNDLKGSYSNMMQIAHTQEEFILDFFNVTPPVGVLTSRIIMSPGHVKRMIQALEENLKKYETSYGQVTPAADTNKGLGFNFDGNT